MLNSERLRTWRSITLSLECPCSTRVFLSLCSFVASADDGLLAVHSRLGPPPYVDFATVALPKKQAEPHHQPQTSNVIEQPGPRSRGECNLLVGASTWRQSGAVDEKHRPLSTDSLSEGRAWAVVAGSGLRGSARYGEGARPS